MLLFEELKEAYHVCQKPWFPKDGRKIDCLVTVTVLQPQIYSFLLFTLIYFAFYLNSHLLRACHGVWIIAILLFLRRVTFPWGAPGRSWPVGNLQEAGSWVPVCTRRPCFLQNPEFLVSSTEAARLWPVAAAWSCSICPEAQPGPVLWTPRQSFNAPRCFSTSHHTRCFFLWGSKGPHPTPWTLPPPRFCPSLRDLVLQAFNPKLLPPVLNLPPGKWGL